MSESMPLATRNAQLVAMRETGRTPNRFLTFSLGGETFAMEIRVIKEILQHGGLTQVPLTPPSISGVINLRGAVVPIIDLATRFGRSPTQVDRRTCIVILEVEEDGITTVMGVVVDHVSEVIEISRDEIDSTPAFGNALRADFIQGVGKVGGKFVILLNVEKILSIAELSLPQA